MIPPSPCMWPDEPAHVQHDALGDVEVHVAHAHFGRVGRSRGRESGRVESRAGVRVSCPERLPRRLASHAEGRDHDDRGDGAGGRARP